jgi:hypothetical protein
MWIRITGGPGVGQEIDAIPAVAMARIHGGTAIALEAKKAETTSVEPRSDKAVAPAQNAPKKKKG